MSNAYEQIRNEPPDIWKSAFANVFGMFVSNVMVQEDCNSPATFQDIIGRYVHVYLDDIFIFSDTLEEHECHIQDVFQRL